MWTSKPTERPIGPRTGWRCSSRRTPADTSAHRPTRTDITMKAIISRRYGPPDVLELRDVDTPVPNDDQLLVRIHAASVNPQDWHLVTGTPYIARPTFGWRTPNEPIPGTD